jgi:hypothetical protein
VTSPRNPRVIPWRSQASATPAESPSRGSMARLAGMDASRSAHQLPHAHPSPPECYSAAYHVRFYWAALLPDAHLLFIVRLTQATMAKNTSYYAVR